MRNLDNFFFQNVIENGISKRDVIAQKTLTVVDTKRTEQHRQDVIQHVEPILIPAEDEFIKVNLDTLQISIMQIRQKNVSESVKKQELGLLFDISSKERKDYLANYFLISSTNLPLNFGFPRHPASDSEGIRMFSGTNTTSEYPIERKRAPN